jgi:hypothetical protein
MTDDYKIRLRIAIAGAIVTFVYLGIILGVLFQNWIL